MAKKMKADTLRLAFYGRYSSDLQSDTSIEDQYRRCSQWCQRNGHKIVTRFEDRAVSGASALNRVGFLELMKVAMSSAPGFDGVIVDDLSRLSRDLADTHHYVKRLRFHGLRLIAVVDGIDTGDAPAKVHVAVKALMNEVYLDNLKEQTKRGLDGRFVQGMSTGGKTFGYRSVALGEGSGARREIHPDEASVVLEIFRRFVDGEGETTIAKDLNRRAVGGKKWTPNVLWHMLRNESYRGHFTFNRYEWIKNPDTGKRNCRERPREDWIELDFPELRIVPEEVWEQSQRRISLRSKAGRGRRSIQRATYLLSGLLHCSCGRAMTLNGFYYACPDYLHTGVCTNSVRFRREAAEALVVTTLRDRLMPFLEELEAQVNEANHAEGDEAKLERLRADASRLEASLKNRVRNLTVLDLDDDLIREVNESIRADKKRLKELNKAIELTQREVHILHIDTSKVKQALQHLDEVIAKDVLLGREFLAAMIDKVEVRPYTGAPAKGWKPGRCPECGGRLARLTPQHAAKHGTTVEGMYRRYPQLGVKQPIEVRIYPNLKDLLPKEEVAFFVVAGAGFEPATFGL